MEQPFFGECAKDTQSAHATRTQLDPSVLVVVSIFPSCRFDPSGSMAHTAGITGCCQRPMIACLSVELSVELSLLLALSCCCWEPLARRPIRPSGDK